MCNLNVIIVLEFISRHLYLLFAIFVSSKFQISFFYQCMRPKSGLKPLGLSFFTSEKKKISVYCMGKFCYINMGFKGVYITRTCLPDVDVRTRVSTTLEEAS